MEDRVLIDWHNGVDEAVFALFDGHNGSECATFLQERYINVLKSVEGFASNEAEKVAAVLKKTALDCDKLYMKEGKQKGWQAGSTGIIAFYRNDNLWISNTGDSRAIAVVDGKAVRLSVDQKPDEPAERQRYVPFPPLTLSISCFGG